MTKNVNINTKLTGVIADIYNTPHLLGHLIGKTKLTDIHSEWIIYTFGTKDGEDKSLQAPRGHYKTTAIDVTGTIWNLLFNPNDRIAIIRKGFNDSTAVLNTIKQSFAIPELQKLFYYVHGIVPKLKIKKQNRLLFNFKKDVTQEGSVDAYGYKTNLTGWHYDKILCDDIITLRDRVSRAEREAVKEIVREIRTNIIDPGKSCMFVGTPWHKDDAWSVCPEPMKYYMSDCNILSAEEIENKRSVTIPSLFAANYLLKHIADEGVLFSDAKFERWKFDNRNTTVAQLDAKFSGDHTNGLTFMQIERKSGHLQTATYCFPEHIDDRLDYVEELYKKYDTGTLYIETNADKGFVAKELKARGMRVKTYHEKMNKHIKISTYIKKHWDNIYFHFHSDDEAIAQITEYREGQEPDDVPDSIASLLREHFDTKNTRAMYEL